MIVIINDLSSKTEPKLLVNNKMKCPKKKIIIKGREKNSFKRIKQFFLDVIYNRRWWLFQYVE